MLKTTLVTTGLTLLLGVTSLAHAQKATEQFIPIGQSPGISGKVAMIGTIESVDTAARSVMVSAGAAPYRCIITDRTRIWIDRSAQKLAATQGRLADLRKGQRVEVKFDDDKARKNAEWVKVEVPR